MNKYPQFAELIEKNTYQERDAQVVKFIKKYKDFYECTSKEFFNYGRSKLNFAVYLTFTLRKNRK